MAIYHLSSQIIGRSGGKSAVASAAYRAGEKIQDEHIGQTFDYTRKRGVDHKEILAPEHSPAWVQDRGRLWNEVEKSEKRINSQLSRELNIALPKELSKDQQIELIRNFAKEQFVDKGMVADLALHNLASENPHAHIMLTTREIGPEGFTKKNREWNDRELLKDWRKEWSVETNQALEKAGVQERVDHRSLKDQGITDRLPQIHVGVHATAMEKRDMKINTELGNKNRAILEINADAKQHYKDIAVYKQEMKQYQAEVKAHEATQAGAPISEPRLPIVQKPQSSVNVEQPRSFKEIQTNFEQAKKGIEGHEEAIEEIKVQLISENYKLQKYIYLDKDIGQVDKEIGQVDKEIGQVEESLGKLSRFNPKNWKERKALEQRSKTLEQSKEDLVRNKQADFGETRREHIEQRITQLDKEKQSENNKLPELNTRYVQTRDAFYQHIAQLNEHDQRSGTPISEPRPQIVQQLQPKTLDPVRKEVSNERNTLSVDEWKKRITQVGNNTKNQIIKMYSKEFPDIRHISEKTAQDINALNTEYGQPLSIKTIKKAYSLAGKNLDADPTDANRATFNKFENVIDGVKQAQMTEKREQAKEKALHNPSKSRSKTMELGDDR